MAWRYGQNRIRSQVLDVTACSKSLQGPMYFQT